MTELLVGAKKGLFLLEGAQGSGFEIKARAFAGLPSDFGFPLMLDPADPDSAHMIPLVADMHRVTPDGRVRVHETRDGGSSWTARGHGLPAEHAYLTVLRQAFSRAGEGEDLELYFGATSGDVFGSGDAGATWSTVATRLPPVFSVVSV